MSEPLARLYDLALRTLDEQERRADARLAGSFTAMWLGILVMLCGLALAALVG